MAIDWNLYKAAVFRPSRQALKPITQIDAMALDALVGIASQKQLLLDNTRAFLRGDPAHHALLWGARGTGKSSLIKALLGVLWGEGLRMIEIAKEDLVHLPDIVDAIREEPFWFVLYCDDLSFEAGDHSYKYLKTILEGSLEAPPHNVLLYATSNRRHLLPEYTDENRATFVAEGELHYGDTVEEKISLSDRFGLWLSFYSGTMEEYLQIVAHYFQGVSVDEATLFEEAKRFAAQRGGARSGRTAKQFFVYYQGMLRNNGLNNT